ncbi:MAG: hypothetical protein JNM93_06985 [Bacteriovoracaceae bacterium]|nr:hypothetical protein [Bacteriovoracaceae bacterium]
MVHAAGKDVLSYCGKCKLTLSHLIMAMDGSKIVRVQCNTCKSVHGHKSAATSSAKKSTTTRTRAPTVPLATIWKEAMTNSKKKSVPYTIQGKFQLGDIVEHKIFGPGVVHSIVDNNKIEVLFQSEIKTLVHNI